MANCGIVARRWNGGEKGSCRGYERIKNRVRDMAIDDVARACAMTMLPVVGVCVWIYGKNLIDRFGSIFFVDD